MHFEHDGAHAIYQPTFNSYRQETLLASSFVSAILILLNSEKVKKYFLKVTIFCMKKKINLLKLNSLKSWIFIAHVYQADALEHDFSAKTTSWFFPNY